MLPVILITSDRKDIDQQIAVSSQDLLHPQVLFFGENEALSIDTIREIAIESSRGSLSTRIYILLNFDVLKGEGQNAFLKTLEEQSEHNIFILSAQDEYAILPTIASRCRIIRIASKEKENFSLLSSLNLFEEKPLAHYLSLTQGLSKEKQIDAIHQIRAYLYKIAHESGTTAPQQKDIFLLLEKIIEIEYQLRNNIYPEFTLDYVLNILKKASLLPLPALS